MLMNVLIQMFEGSVCLKILSNLFLMGLLMSKEVWVFILKEFCCTQVT